METQGVSQIVMDSFLTFSKGFADSAEVIISSMMSDFGIYDAYRLKANDNTITSHRDAVYRLQESYIWSEVPEVSEVLRCSFLYNTTYNALGCVIWMNDESLSVDVIAFKHELVKFIKENSVFLAYCDMEQSGLFLYSNGSQAIDQKTFDSCHNEALKKLQAMNKKYDHKVPRIMMTIITVLKNLICVRERFSDTLIRIPSLDILPKPHKYNRDDITLAVNMIPTCGLYALRVHLELAYSQLTHIHVLSSLKWLITMNGPKTEYMVPLSGFVGEQRLRDIRRFTQMLSALGNKLCMKGELSKLPFMSRVTKLMADPDFFEEFSLSHLGEVPMCILNHAIRLYMKNVNAIVLADLLFSGFYDAVTVEHHPPIEEVTSFISKLKNDINGFTLAISVSISRKNLCNRVLKTLHTYLKKLQRYHHKLCHLHGFIENDTQQSSNIMSLLFGDVYDIDGQPTLCAICLENSKEKQDGWWQMPCGHKFHMDCANELVECKHTNCPLCRTTL